LHDYAGGVADAKAGLIRFVGDPATRIREDYLRILRFFRFQASHGHGAPDSTGLQACARLKSGLAGLSRERVRQELLKLIAAPGAADAASAMDGIGLWPEVLPGLPADVAAFRRWVDLRRLFPGPPDVMAGLAALLPPDTIAEAVGLSLKLSRQEEKALEVILRHAGAAVDAGTSRPHVRQVVYTAGPLGFAAALQVGAARQGLAGAVVTPMLESAGPVLAAPPRLPFTSRDVEVLGVAPGPAMGKALRQATRSWIAAGCPEDRTESLALLRSAVSGAPD
jgi:poly(A) polymerase